MNIRTRHEFVTFEHPFLLRDVGRELPAGTYEVVTDEELLESLSFAAYRRVSTMLMVRIAPQRAEMLQIDPVQLAAAEERDRRPNATVEKGSAK